MESNFSDVPLRVTIASAGRAIIAFGYADDFASAITWCGRAMQQFPDADKIAIGWSTLAEWAGIGKASMILPYEDWTRELDGWQHATQCELQRFFERVPVGPRTLMTEAPPRTTGVLTAPRRAANERALRVR